MNGCSGGRFHAQNVHRDFLEIAEQFDVVLNSRLSKRAVVTGKERPRLRFGIRRHNKPCACASRIADSKYFIFRSKMRSTVSRTTLVLRAHFAPDILRGHPRMEPHFL